MEREGLICSAQNRNKMTFEGLDGLFSSITTVIMRRDELVRHIIMLDLLFELSRTLIVQDMHLWMYVLFVQAINQDLVSAHHLSRCPVAHCLDQYIVGSGLVKAHDVPHAVVGRHREFARLI